MAAPRLARTLMCPNCLGQMPSARSATLASRSVFAFTQVRGAKMKSKADEEDLQGIPVRLLHDIIGFGRKNAIIRVKPGRMRNVWHHKGLAEYMTQKRFAELGLTSSAIGVRDRTFGTQLVLEEEETPKKAKTKEAKRPEPVSMGPEESRTLLDDLLPQVLVFARKPIAAAPAPEPEPTIKRSPALAANASISGQAETPLTPADTTTTSSRAIFGSVSTVDVLTHVRDVLFAADNGSRVALEAESIAILGLEEGEDRIKRLGRWEVEISTGKGVEKVRRALEVVPEE